MSATSAAILPKLLPKIDNVLFPTDFSRCAQAALPYACALAQQHNATLHLLNVIGPSGALGELGVPHMEPAAEADAARRDLARIAEAPAVKALKHETCIGRGAVWDATCQLAGEKQHAVIVMGTHGRRGVRQFVLGSVAEQVFRHSECPVLTVGPGASKTGPANGRFSTILLAVDLSPECLWVVNWAHMLALANQSRLILFHSIRPQSASKTGAARYLEETIDFAKTRMSTFVPKDVPWTDVAIKIGNAAENIVETSVDRDADLIVIGARRGRNLAAHTPWAVAHEVICAAQCPVLMVSH